MEDRKRFKDAKNEMEAQDDTDYDVDDDKEVKNSKISVPLSLSLSSSLAGFPSVPISENSPYPNYPLNFSPFN